MFGKKRFSLFLFSLCFFSGYSQGVWLYLPHNDAITGDQHMTFEWRRKSLNTTYTLQIATDSVFTAPLSVFTTETRATVSGLTYGQTYWWRVQGSGGEVSPERRFEVMDLKAAGPLSLWFRADSAVTADSTGLVSVWTDLSDSARTAVQASPFLMPQLISSSFNSLPSVRFGKTGGSGQQTPMSIPPLALNGPICVFSVHRILTNTSPLQYLFGNTNSGLFLGGTASGLNNSGLFDGTNVFNATGPFFMNLNQTTWRKNSIRRNGAGLTTTGTVGNFTINTFGNRPDVTSLFFNGLLPEVLIYKSALADADRDKIERYLASKYARPARLPADTVVCGPSLALTLPGGTEEFSAILWSTGATGTGITVTQNGTYWVRGTSRLGGYITTDTIRVSGILPNPVITPTQPQILCATRDSVTLRNLSANPNFTFQWSTGSPEDTARVSNAGPYYLQAFDASTGCVLTSDTIRLINKTLADFANPPACPGADALFSDLSVDLLGDTVITWSWNFGDPSTTQDISTDTNGVWIYPNSGTYPVFLKVTTSDGCKDSLIKNVIIKPTAVPNFTWQGPCYGKPTQFFDASVPENGTQVTGYQWNFGPGINSNFVNPAITYNTAGTYPVSLTVYTASGCNETIVQQIPVNKGAIAGFNMSDTLCSRQPVNALDISEGVNDVITNWRWRFGSNAPILAQNPDFAFQNTGNRIVRLTVTTSAGCTDSIQKTVFVNPAPTAAFTLNGQGGNPPFIPQVNNQSTGADSYVWSVGNYSDTSFAPVFSAFSDTGSYTMTLSVLNEEGCADTISRNFVVFTGTRSLELLEASCTQENGFMGYTARIINKGVLDVSDITLEANTGYNQVVQEKWTGTLLPGQILNYSFVSTSKVNTLDEFCCVKISSFNDTLSVLPPDDKICLPLTDDAWFSASYPNPGEGIVTIDYTLPFDGILSATLFTVDGKMVKNALEKQAVVSGFGSYTVDISELKSGVYVMRFFYRDAEYSVKLVKR